MKTSIFIHENLEFLDLPNKIKHKEDGGILLTDRDQYGEIKDSGNIQELLLVGQFKNQKCLVTCLERMFRGNVCNLAAFHRLGGLGDRSCSENGQIIFVRNPGQTDFYFKDFSDYRYQPNSLRLMMSVAETCLRCPIYRRGDCDPLIQAVNNDPDPLQQMVISPMYKPK